MHATESTGLGRATRHVSVRMTIAGALASAALLISLNPTAIAIMDQLQTLNAGTAQTLALRQAIDNGSVVSAAGSAAAIADGNAYGGHTVSFGRTSTQTVTFTNTGTAPVTSLTAMAAPCSQVSAGLVAGTATDFCDKVLIGIATEGVTIFKNTADAFGRAGAVDVLSASGTRSVAPGRSINLDITITMSPAMDNTYQGLQLDQPITWRFGA